MSSLRTRLIALLLLTALLPLAVSTYSENCLLHRALTDTARQSLLSTVSQTADDIDQFLATCLDDIRTEAQLPSIREFLLNSNDSNKRNLLMEELNALSRKDSLYIRSYGLLDLKGVNLADTKLPSLGSNEAQFSYFSELLIQPRAYVSPVLRFRSQEEGASLFLSAPIMNNENKVLGVLRVEYKSSILQKLISENAEQAGRDILALLVDGDGIILANNQHPETTLTPIESNNDVMIKTLAAAGRITNENRKPMDTEGLRTGLSGTSSKPFFTFKEIREGQPTIYTAAAVPMTRCPWTVVIAKPMESLLEPMNEQLRQGLAVVGAISILAVLLGLLFSELLTRPFTQLRQVADLLASGDLNARARIEGGAESEALATTFNRMAERLQETIQQLHGLVETLRSLGEEREQLIRELEHRNREWEGILYATSHDLRSPLVNIQGFCARLEKSIGEMNAFCAGHFDTEISGRAEELLSERIPKSLHFIQASASKMDTLISSLLKLSRSGRAQLHFEQIDMEALLDTVFSTIAFQLQHVGAVLNRDPLPPCWGDSTQLEQVFSNLLDNAVKYRDPERPLVLTISGKEKDNRVVYSICDTGRGIDLLHCDRIWDVFHRVDPEHSEPGEGLGLALARRIVERHSGRIWVESNPDSGSCFYVELPVKEVLTRDSVSDTENGMADGL